MWWLYKMAGFNFSRRGKKNYLALWENYSLPKHHTITTWYDATARANDCKQGVFRFSVATGHVSSRADVLRLVCLLPVVAWTWHVCEELSAVEHFSQWALQDLIDHTLLHVHQHRLWIQICEYEASTYISLYAEHMALTPWHHSITPLCNLNQWMPNCSFHRIQPWLWPWL